MTILSNRLKAVAGYVQQDMIVADIGSDHAYLPCYLIENGIIQKAIAGEVIQGPFQVAKQQVAERGYTEEISVRLGSGLNILTTGEASCLTICGMGGKLIAEILEAGIAKLTGRERLILQPNMKEIAVRLWAKQYNWQIIAEEILEEADKIYEIIVIEKAPLVEASKIENDQDLLFGPFLRKEKSSTFIKKWTSEKAHLLKINQQLAKTNQTTIIQKKQKAILAQIQWIEEVTS